MRTFLNRDNAFKMILFLSMLIMALYHFFFNDGYVSQITSFLGLLVFILSVLNMVISVLEKLIQNYDKEIYDCYAEISNKYPNDIWKIENDITSCTKKQLFNKICTYEYLQSAKEFFVKFWFLLNYRKNIRKTRRFFLYLYFATITLILVFLFLSHELLPYLKNSNFGDWTILSFVIILFEILIKDGVSNCIYSCINDILTNKQKKYVVASEGKNNG